MCWSVHYYYLCYCKMNLDDIDDPDDVEFCRTELEWRVKGEGRRAKLEGIANYIRDRLTGMFIRNLYGVRRNLQWILPDSTVVRTAKDEIGSGFAKGHPSVLHLKELQPGVGYWKDYSYRHNHCGHGHWVKMWARISRKAYKSIGRYFSAQGLIYEGLFAIFRC